MTGRIIHLHGDPHREVLALLPWHVTGQLGAADTDRVEAHLENCAACRAALAMEQRLDREIVRAPAGVDEGWAEMRQRLDLDYPSPAGALPRREAARRNDAWAKWLRWPVAWRLGPPLAFASLAALLLLPLQLPARFTALGTATPPVAGNLLVIFRPDTSEAEFRQTLRFNAARLVDGPTAANAYILAVPAATRTAALDRMRRQPQIMLAEPIEASGQP